jgi:hypothetical protein
VLTGAARARLPRIPFLTRFFPRGQEPSKTTTDAPHVNANGHGPNWPNVGELSEADGVTMPLRVVPTHQSGTTDNDQ